MPHYLVREVENGKVHELPLMSWAQLQTFLEEYPQYEQALTAPAMVKVN